MKSKDCVMSAITRSKSKLRISQNTVIFAHEYILEGKTILIPILCKLFNVIVCTSRFPELWVKSVIVPLFQKGSSHRIKHISLLVLIKSFQFISKRLFFCFSKFSFILFSSECISLKIDSARKGIINSK
jgi:hypothetical protein